MLVEKLDRLLGAFPVRLQRYALARLRKMGVDVILGHGIRSAEADRVLLDDGTTIPSYMVMWAAGVRASALSDALDVPREHGGQVDVEPDLTLGGHPEVYAIGDMAYVAQDGRPLPQMAPVAMQQGRYAARHILAREKGKDSLPPFRYFDRGTMSVIGRGAAVATVFGVHLTGFPAWLAWLGLHLFELIDFRNRLVVLISWAYDYLLFERKVRLITDPTERPAPPVDESSTPLDVRQPAPVEPVAEG